MCDEAGGWIRTKTSKTIMDFKQITVMLIFALQKEQFGSIVEVGFIGP